MTYGLGGRRRVRPPAPTWLLVLALLSCLGGAALAQDTVASDAQLRAVAALGGTYTLAAGTFEVFEPIEVTRDLTLIGQGGGATAILVGAGPAALRVVDGARLHLAGVDVSRLANESPSSDLIQVLDGHLELVDVRLAWAKAGGEDPMKRFGLGSALYVAGASTAALTDVTLERNGLAAIEIVDDGRVEVKGSLFVDNAYGVFITDAADVSISSSSITGSLANAIAARGHATLSVNGSEIVANGNTLEVSGLEFDAVRVGEDATATLTANSFTDNPRYALSVTGAASVLSEDNSFENNGGYEETADLYFSALLLEEGAVMESRRDRFFANHGGAIELNDEADGTFVSTTVERTGSFASVYSESSGALRFVDLTAIDNEGCVCLFGGTVTFEGGLLARNGEDAIYAEGVKSLVVTGVTIRDHAVVAVTAYETASLTITGNLFASNGAGILIGSGSRAEVMDNRIETGSSAGPAIAFHAAASGTVSGNRVRQPDPGNAIRVLDPSRVSVGGNDVADEE